MLSRMKDWVGLGSTGYPFVFVKNVDAGIRIYLTSSADHLCSTPMVVGSGGVKSNAMHQHEN
jgi:hypothetical protein